MTLDEIVERAGGPERAGEHLALRVGLDEIDVASLSLELVDPRLFDRPVEVAELARLDAHGLDPRRGAEPVVVCIDAVVSLEDRADAPDPRPAKTGRRSGDHEGVDDRIQCLLVVDEPDQELERPRGPHERVGQHRRPDGGALGRDPGMVEVARQGPATMGRPDDDRHVRKLAQARKRVGGHHRQRLEDEDRLDTSVGQAATELRAVLGRGDRPAPREVNAVIQRSLHPVSQRLPIGPEVERDRGLPERVVRKDEPYPGPLSRDARPPAVGRAPHSRR